MTEHLRCVQSWVVSTVPGYLGAWVHARAQGAGVVLPAPL